MECVVLGGVGAVVLCSLMADRKKEHPKGFEACGLMSLWLKVLLNFHSSMYRG